jgi:hypothetical protein
MTQAVKHRSVISLKLVKLLSEYNMTNIEVTYSNFAERLGLLVDLSDSVTLSESLRAIPTMRHEARDSQNNAQCDSLVQEFLGQRSAILKSILKSFDPSAVFIQFKLPIPNLDTSIEDALNFEQYQRFYLLHQSELDFKIDKLRCFVRKVISEYSLNLTQLAELDKTFSKSMAAHTRKRFTVVPKLLKFRFEQLYADYCKDIKQNALKDKPIVWVNDNGWLSKFYAEMQQVLLAELDVRLQPIIGLVEAYSEEIEN